MSEAPVLTKFTKLADFISRVGERASQETVTTYLQRLREQGCNATTTVKKAIDCGLKIAKEVRQRKLAF